MWLVSLIHIWLIWVALLIHVKGTTHWWVWHTYMHTHAQTKGHIEPHVHRHTWHTHWDTLTQTHTNAITHTRTCTHTRTHAHTYTHTQKHWLSNTHTLTHPPILPPLHTHIHPHAPSPHTQPGGRGFRTCISLISWDRNTILSNSWSEVPTVPSPFVFLKVHVMEFTEIESRKLLLLLYTCRNLPLKKKFATVAKTHKMSYLHHSFTATENYN